LSGFSIERLIKKDHFYTLVIQSCGSGENQEKFLGIIHQNKMRIVKETIEKDTAAGKSLYEYIISTNRAFNQESFIGAFLMLPEIQKVSVH
jgi:hypothetical protein